MSCDVDASVYCAVRLVGGLERSRESFRRSGERDSDLRFRFLLLSVFSRESLRFFCGLGGIGGKGGRVGERSWAGTILRSMLLPTLLQNLELCSVCLVLRAKKFSEYT